METQIRTPQFVFMHPQRLVVPLFQRPYVWNEENQWEPLWNDVVRVADRVLSKPTDKHHPHFLGAVVLQQVNKPTGQMQERIIIDGQQRLTTLQLLLHALCIQLQVMHARQAAMRIEPLIRNAEPFCLRDEDRYKVWPTNRDRKAFYEVINRDAHVDGNDGGRAPDRMHEAHRFFSERAREWLGREGAAEMQARAAAIETVVRDLLQMVVIDLAPDENAQEIFETLNARGAQLTAADLIKNFIFQRLLENGTDVEIEEAYQSYWKEFETAFWETEVSLGRLRYPRSAVFLNHWLIAQTGEEVVAREVFNRFKRFADHDSGLPMLALLQQLHRAAGVYRNFVVAGSANSGAADRLALFGYRTAVLESEVIKPLVLYLRDPEKPPIPDPQLGKCLDAVESWMVRRMLVRATTKNYNQTLSELIATLRRKDREAAGDVVERFLAGQPSVSQYWPDDAELERELRVLPAYRRLGRGRLRMVLEAIEDHLRGWNGGQQAFGGERVPRGKLAIEHIMPNEWRAHWPLAKAQSETDRDEVIHTIGNLTLLTGRLNSKVSNGPWNGSGGKRAGLEGHDVLMLNRDIVKKAGGQWTDALIRERTGRLVQIIAQTWPVPSGHRSGVAVTRSGPTRKVELSDLVAGQVLLPGSTLHPRVQSARHRAVTLMADGQLEVDGQVFATPSDAARAITGRPSTNGWWYFLVDVAAKRSLRMVRDDYARAMAMDADEENDADDDNDA